MLLKCLDITQIDPFRYKNSAIFAHKTHEM